MRGTAWTAVVATSFYWLSNPLVLTPVFEISLLRAVIVCLVVTVAGAAWIRVPRVSWALVGFLVFTLASALWSQSPSSTLLAWQLYACIAFIAVVTYTHVTTRVLVQGFVGGGVLVSVASLYAMHQLLPGSYYLGLDGEPLIIGVGTNQNILAYTLTLALCGVCAAVPKDRTARVLWLAAGGVIGYTLVITESSTGDLTAIAIIVSALALLALQLLRGRQRPVGRRRWWWPAALVVGCTLIVVIGHDRLGTVSGRVPFWKATVEVAREHLWFGPGFGSVWPHPWKLAPDNPVVAKIYTSSGAYLTHGHNAFIDLLPEVGLIGLALVVAMLVQVGLTARRLRRGQGVAPDDDGLRARFSILCLVDLMIFGITEPMLTIPLGWWALVLLTEPYRSARRADPYDQPHHPVLATENL